MFYLDPSMAEKFPYTSVPNSLRKFLKDVPSRGIPDKVTNKYLTSIGLKSSNDKTVVSVLKAIKLLDAGASPTEDYKLFRDKSRGPAILASRIKETYKELYEAYEDAHRKNDDDLCNFFRAHSKLGDKAIKLQAATFKVLCEFADFQQVSVAASINKEVVGTTSSPQTPSIHINLQIHLPVSKDPTVYDQIIQALAKHFAKGTPI